MDTILRALQSDEYRVIDTNEHGLELLRKGFPDSRRVTAINLDVLNLPSGADLADVVFSVGLVEHFAPAETAKLAPQPFREAGSRGVL